MGETKRRSIVDNEREFLKSKTAYVLPDNPSSKGWSASQSKAKMYEGILLLYDWFKDYESITSDNFNLIETNIGKIVDGHTIVGKAKCDEDGNDIKLTYSTISKANLLQEYITKIIDGTTIVDKADKDSEGNIIANTYIKNEKIADSKNSSNISKITTLAIVKELVEDLSTMIKNGSITASKATNDGDGNSIANTYVKNNKVATSKNSVDTSQITTLSIVKELINDLSNKLINGSVESLDTLKELAEALGNDSNFATTITNLIGQKLSIEAATQTYSTKVEFNEVKTKIDNFVDTWEEMPKVSTLGSGRYSIVYEEWIGKLGDGRYSLPLNQ